MEILRNVKKKLLFNSDFITPGCKSWDKSGDQVPKISKSVWISQKLLT